LLITKGFKDLLSIGNQARPRIFDLHIVKPGHLYEDVIEVDERVTLVGFSSDPYQSAHAVKFAEDGTVSKGYTGAGTQAGLLDAKAKVVQGLSGEAVHVLKEVDQAAVRDDLQRLYDNGYRSIAVVLAHS
jgi:5-oxoprolinase (ATP-hydrolysing)